MRKKITAFLVLIMTIIMFVSCEPMGSGYKGTSDIADVQKFLNKQTKDKITDIELIHKIHVDEWIWNNSIEFDGAVFWEGNTKVIPEHDILFFRGYSPKSESYVFLQFNDKENTESYYTLYYYAPKTIKKQKEDIEKIATDTKNILLNKGIEVKKIHYRFLTEEDDLDNLYIQSKEFFDEFFLENDFYIQYKESISLKTSYQFWIIIETDDIKFENDNEYKEFQKSIMTVYDDIETYAISIAIRPENSEDYLYTGTISFYKTMKVY